MEEDRYMISAERNQMGIPPRRASLRKTSDIVSHKKGHNLDQETCVLEGFMATA